MSARGAYHQARVSYLLYYLAIFFFSYAARNPYVLVVVLALFLLRELIPDPAALWRALVHMRRRKTEIELNPSNVPARRDLARLYLDLRMPRTAIRVLEEARARAPREREIAYLEGLARLRANDARGALDALARAAGMNPETGAFDTESKPSPQMSKSRDADVFLLTATALERLGHLDQAEEALLSACAANSSSMEARVRLAALYGRLGKRDLAKRAHDDASRTWSTLPGFAKRGQWSWYLRSFVV